MSETKALATTPGGGAIASLGAGAAIQFSLSKFPEADYNRLVPTETLIVSDLLMPVVQVVKLDFEDDTYKSNDVPANHRAPGARALNKFATAAGLSFLSETRVDDGRNPNLIRVQVVVGMKLPTGQWVTATGTREVDLDRRKWASPAERGKFESFFYEHTATRARSRAIRAILSLKSSYTDAEIRKPFAVVSLVPNTQHPEVRRAMLAGLERSERALFGPGPESAKAIGPGTEDVALPEAAEDDVSEGQFTEQAAGDEPEWFKGATPVAPVAEQGHRLERMLRAEAAKLEADPAMKEPRSDEQADNLKKLLNPIGFDSVVRVLGRVFGLKNIGDITRAQASALFIVDQAEDHFADLWRELDAIAQAQR